MPKTPQSDCLMSTIHWPGGIPRELKPHPKADLSQDELREEIKGWLLFVQESWLPRDQANISDNDKEYELRQRRALVQQWASESQDFRDVRPTQSFQPLIES